LWVKSVNNHIGRQYWEFNSTISHNSSLNREREREREKAKERFSFQRYPINIFLLVEIIDEFNVSYS